MRAMTTPTMIAGTRVCDDFGGSRSCVGFGASADEACTSASGFCTSIVSSAHSTARHCASRVSAVTTCRGNLGPEPGITFGGEYCIESAHGRQRPALCFNGGVSCSMMLAGSNTLDTTRLLDIPPGRLNFFNQKH